MELVSQTRVNSSHTRYVFAHKFRPRRHDAQLLKITVVAFSQERALKKAWEELAQTYKLRKAMGHIPWTFAVPQELDVELMNRDTAT